MESLTVFFDVGGTLVGTPDLFGVVTNKLTSKRSDNKVRDLVRDKFTQLLHNTESYLRLEDILVTTLLNIAKEHKYPDISSEALDIFWNTFLHETNLFPETIHVLDMLYENDVRMVIASDADAEILDELLVKYDLKKYFIDICTSELVKAYKPSTEFANYLRKYTLNNEASCYLVGDNKADIECGKKLGIKSVLVDRSYSKGQMDADHVIHTLNELLTILPLR